MIRKATSQDAEKIVDIWLESSLRAHHFISAEYWLANKEAMRTTYLPSCTTYVWEDKASAEIYGFVSMNKGYLAAIFVAPEMQGRGIGKELMNYVKRLLPQITLSVYAKNAAAIAFYKHEGFVCVEERTDTNTREKEWVMVYSPADR